MSNPASLLLYIISFSTAALALGIGVRKKSWFIIILSLLIPAMISGFRYGVGTDFDAYINIYNQMSDFNIQDYFTYNTNNIEMGFFLIIKIASLLDGGAELMFGISSLITLVFLYLGLRRLEIKHISLALFLYLLMIFPLTLNGVRQGISVSILFYAFTFAAERRWWKFLFWALIASLFHLSALVFIPLYAITRYSQKLSRQNVIIVALRLLPLAMLIIAVSAIIINSALNLPLLDKYRNYFESGGGSGIGIYVLSLINVAIALILKDKLEAKDRYMNFYIVLSIIGLGLATLGLGSSAIHRISLYFMIYPILIIVTYADIFNDYLGNKLSRTLIILYPVVYFVLIYYLFDLGDIFPYNSTLIGGGQ